MNRQFHEIHNLSSKNIIEGVGHDSRIGNHYNNPSFDMEGIVAERYKTTPRKF